VKLLVPSVVVGIDSKLGNSGTHRLTTTSPSDYTDRMPGEDKFVKHFVYWDSDPLVKEINISVRVSE